ncbi:MAG: adenosylcobinamide-GDP ribazoletransferase [Marinovum sp.]|nr:adenosylcobinamide-GDP ribazoletransferase [Marinovum sp.]
MTRLPVPWHVEYSAEAQADSARYYPLVGVVVGSIAAFVLWIAQLIWAWPIAVIMAVATAVWITGALHEDGLADTADGLGGAATRERALDIMRDSSIGVYGLIALLVVVSLKVFALFSMSFLTAYGALLLAHVISRYAPVALIHFMTYARREGAKFATPSISSGGHGLGLLTAVVFGVVGMVFLGWSLLLGLLIASLAVLWLSWRAQNKLGGYTGDILGASQQLAELGIYLGLIAWA